MTTHIWQWRLSGTYLKSSRVSWIIFWMKWICREVRGAAPPCPTTSTMFWEREEDTAAESAEPKGPDDAVGSTNDSAVVVLRAEVIPHKCTCYCGWIVAQLILNAIGPPEARFRGEEGWCWLAKIGLKGRGGRGMNFTLQTGTASFMGLKMKTCYPAALHTAVFTGLSLYLRGVTWLGHHSRCWLLLFDGGGLVDRQRAEASPCGGYQRCP